MVRTNRIEVHSDSKTTRNGQTTSKKYSTDDQLEVVRRLLKLLMAFCVGHLILSVVTATSLGVYVSEHVRYISWHSDFIYYNILNSSELKIK